MQFLDFVVFEKELFELWEGILMNVSEVSQEIVAEIDFCDFIEVGIFRPF